MNKEWLKTLSQLTTRLPTPVRYIGLGVLLGTFVFPLVLNLTDIFFKGFFDRLELSTLDFRYDLQINHLESRSTPIEDIVIVDIDARSVFKLGRYGRWPRSYHAAVVDYLKQGGAKAIGLDILFAGEEEREYDQRLTEAVTQAGNVYTAVYLLAADSTNFLYAMDQDPYRALNPHSTLSLPAPVRGRLYKKNAERIEGPFPALAQHAKGLVAVNTWPDQDGVHRAIPLMMSFASNTYPTISLGLAMDVLGVQREEVHLTLGQQLTLGQRRTISVDEQGRMLLHYYGQSSPKGQTFRYVSYYDVYSKSIPAKFFIGKIVLIGSSLPGQGDLVSVPFGSAFPGVELHATAIQNIVKNDFLTKTSRQTTILLVLGLSVLVSILALMIRSWKGAILTLILIVAYSVATVLVFVRYGLWVEVVRPEGAILLSYLTINIVLVRIRQREAREQERVLREQELVRLVEARTKDLVEEKQKTEEQAKKLVELDQIKTRFFANISHEFRTPLTLTIGPLENALAGAYGTVSGALHPQLDMMLRNARRLLRLINQLLDISKLEAGQMTLRARRENVVRFLKETTALFESLAERKHITLQLQTERDDLELYFDGDKLEKVMYNLLSNAFKFTPEQGKIWVTVTDRPSEAGDAGEGLVEITVKDTGRGIPTEELPYIFDRFRQVGAAVREQEGTGIGLSLVKDLVALHGGTIRVTSEPGFGSAFTITLPKGRAHLTSHELADGEPEEVPTDGTSRERVELAGLEGTVNTPVAPDQAAEPDNQALSGAETILLVDDNADVRAYIRGFLAGLYRVIEAQDGAEGLRTARECLPDLIISDVMMPKMDGYELCRTVKADEHLNHIPVILLTAKASDDMKVEGLEVGADDYLSKPFNARELLARTHNLITMRRQEKDLKRFNEALEQQVREQLDTILKSKQLTRYIPPQLVDRILQSEEAVTLASARKNITIFFSDLTDFTDLSDRTEPERITEVLNEYLTAMVALLDQYGGTPARFMGDGIMAFFGAHDGMDRTAQATQTVGMAVAMQKKMNTLSQKWLDEGLDHATQIRIGIAQDYVTLGNFGTQDFMEYTALGVGVNLASRLEASCPPGRILVSFPVYALTKDLFPYEALQERQLKGFARVVRVCELDPEKMPG